jgi:hypothetical protein
MTRKNVFKMLFVPERDLKPSMSVTLLRAEVMLLTAKMVSFIRVSKEH